MHDKELLGALHLLVFGGERQICVLTLIQEKKVDREGNGLKQIVHKRISYK